MRGLFESLSFIFVPYSISFCSLEFNVMRTNTEDHLASYATRSVSSRGRVYEEKVSDKRLCFELDRDRIIHAKAFRRLNGKTQVFVADSGAHYRTRLTHTLEVAQVARGLARDLSLNEDLAEAIALAHDLGHPPFGHAGEAVLDEIMRGFGLRFEHNEQSRRVVEVLERSFEDFPGLNLTLETLDGLIKHQTAFDQQGRIFETSAHLEAQVVNLADEIAYTSHDIDDGLRSGIITIEVFEEMRLWQLARSRVVDMYGDELGKEVFIRRMVSEIMTLMCEDCAQMMGRFSEEMSGMVKEVRRYLYDSFYLSEMVVAKTNHGTEMLRKVFGYYLKNMKELPEAYSRDEIGVKDYVAGMTDLYLMKRFKEL